MKQNRKRMWMLIFVGVCLIPVIFCLRMQTDAGHTYTETAASFPKQANASEEFRACWISYIDIQNCLAGKNEAAFRAKLNEMYDRIQAQGLNTVIVHARAMGDAFYPSDYFPLSKYLSEGRKELAYDPYAIMVDLAHEKGLRFEAWINPYRISLSDETTESFMQTEFYERYAPFILQFEGAQGLCLALDPASEQTRELIVGNVSEILARYEVDGIHFDDYFYMDGMADDLTKQQKKDAVNALVFRVYQVIKETNTDCVFGISPAGNPDYARQQGADIDTWLSADGYVDYVMPQIYWTDHYRTADGTTMMFTERCRTWKSLHTNEQVKLYVGLALYRVGEESETEPDWSASSENLAAQCACAYGLGYAGFGLFRYQYLESEHADAELAALLTFLQKQEGVIRSDIRACVVYCVHRTSYGWQSAKADGVVAGATTGEKPIEAIRLQLGSLAGGGGIVYSVSSQAGGAGTWVSNGEQAGTTGQSDPVTAFAANLTGTAAQSYDIAYRVYTESSGWSDWFQNGEQAGGTELFAIQVKLVKKSDK